MGNGPKIKGQATARPVAAARITPEQAVAEPVAERSRVAEEKLTPANAATAESFIETVSRIGMDNYAKLDPSTFTGEIGELIKEQLDTMPNTVSNPATYQSAWKRVKNLFDLSTARLLQVQADDMDAFSKDVKNNLDKKAKATMPDNWAQSLQNELKDNVSKLSPKMIESYFKEANKQQAYDKNGNAIKLQKVPKRLIDDLVKASSSLYVANADLKFATTMATAKYGKMGISPESRQIGVRLAEQTAKNKIRIAQAAYEVVANQIIDAMLPA